MEDIGGARTDGGVTAGVGSRTEGSETTPAEPGSRDAAHVALAAGPVAAAPIPAVPVTTVSTPAGVCPFLRSVEQDGMVGPPAPAPAPRNQCFATTPALPQAARQQQLVCLEDAHATCPRYLRGSLRLPDAPPPRQRRKGTPRAIVAAVLILLFSASGALAFAVARGGLAVSGLATLPSEGSPAATLAAIASVTPATASPSFPGPTAAAASPTAARSPATTQAPATPRPTPPPTPRPTPRPTASSAIPGPGTGSASRYAVLTACPDRPACYIYVVRPGDNFFSIIHWFGVPNDVALRLNPWLRDPSLLVAGDRLVLPPPTR